MNTQTCEKCGQEGEGLLCHVCAYQERMNTQLQMLRFVEAELGLEEGEAEWPLSDGGW